MEVREPQKCRKSDTDRPLVADHFCFVLLGAGFAGIAAGRYLSDYVAQIDSTLDFQIFEASDRIGGRVLNKEFGSNPATGTPYSIEVGSSDIVGLTGNPVGELGLQYGIVGFFQNYSILELYDENDRLNEAEGAYAAGTNCLRSYDAFLGVQRLSNFCYGPDAGEPFFNSTVSNFCFFVLGNDFEYQDDDDTDIASAQVLINGFVPSMEENPAIARLCELYQMDWEFSTTPDKVSVRESYPMPALYDFEPFSYFVMDPRGYVFILKKAASEYLQTTVNTTTEVVLADEKLKLNHKIIKVEWDPTGQKEVSLTYCTTSKVENADSPVLYPCVAGSDTIVRASYFISTFSVGVLKEVVAMEQELGFTGGNIDLDQTRNRAPVFDPPLSSIAPLNQAITDAGFGFANYIYMQFPFKFWPDDVQFFLSAHSSGEWVAEFAPVWIPLDTGATVPGEAPFLYPGSNIIVLTVVGERSRQINSMTDQAIIAEVLPVLNGMFRDGIRENGRQTLEPSDVLAFDFARWATDPLFRGMTVYDSIALQDSTPLESRHGNLVMSGEFSCYRHKGWTQGAAFAGQRSVQALLHEKYKGATPEMTLCDFDGEELGLFGRRLEQEDRYMEKGMKFISVLERGEWTSRRMFDGGVSLTREDLEERFKEFGWKGSEEQGDK